MRSDQGAVVGSVDFSFWAVAMPDGKVSETSFSSVLPAGEGRLDIGGMFMAPWEKDDMLPAILKIDAINGSEQKNLTKWTLAIRMRETKIYLRNINE